LCGALVNDHLQGHYLDEPRYDQVWAALEELSVPLYLHPGAPPADRWKVLDGRPELYGATWSWAAETGGHALRVIYSGVFDRHPGGQADLRAHGRVLAVHAQPAGLSLGHPRSAGSAAAAAVGLHRLQRGDHHQRRVLPPPRSPAPRPSCSPSTTRMSPGTKPWPGSSGPRSATPAGTRSPTATLSASCGCDPTPSPNRRGPRGA
jgi:Amidohydrolase